MKSPKRSCDVDKVAVGGSIPGPVPRLPGTGNTGSAGASGHWRPSGSIRAGRELPLAVLSKLRSIAVRALFHVCHAVDVRSLSVRCLQRASPYQLTLHVGLWTGSA